MGIYGKDLRQHKKYLKIIIHLLLYVDKNFIYRHIYG